MKFYKIKYLVIALFISIQTWAISLDKITINGYSSFEIEKQLSQKGAGDKNASFDADLLDLVFNFQATDNVRVSMDVTWEHGAATEENKGNVAIEYGFAEYAVNNKFKIRFGKFLTPFGYFNEIHTAKPSFLSVKEASSTNKTERLAGNGFRFFPRWGTGISLKGNLNNTNFTSDYDILIANGEAQGYDINQHEEDHRNSKSITARYRFEATNNLKLALSGYHDPYPGKDIKSLTSYGILLQYDINKWTILFEAVQGKKITTNPSNKIKQTGYFIQASYSFEHSGFTPYFRYEYVDPNNKISKNAGLVYILGINYEIDESLMLKIEDHLHRGQSQTQDLNKYPNNGYNEIKIALVVGF